MNEWEARTRARFEDRDLGAFEYARILVILAWRHAWIRLRIRAVRFDTWCIRLRIWAITGEWPRR